MKNSNIFILFLAMMLLFDSVRAQSGESGAEITIRAKALNNEAVKKVEEEKFAEAIELFRRAISLRPDYAIAYGNLGGTLYRTRQFAEAIAVLKKAIQINPAYAEAHHRLGMAYFETDKNDEAVEFLKTRHQIRTEFYDGIPQFGLRLY